MSKLKNIADRLAVLAVKHCNDHPRDFSEISELSEKLDDMGDMDDPYTEAVSKDIAPPPMKLYTENIPGNIHESAIVINKRGWAEYLVSMTFNTGHYTIAVFRMPLAMVNTMRADDPSYYTKPSHDDPEGL